MESSSQGVVVVLGATASGKTELGVAIARQFGGEIVSADSRQVYRELDIGAGKDREAYGTGEERVPYHLIDVAGLDEEFSVFDYQRQAFEVLDALKAREVLPVIVGGTGLYLEAVLQRYAMVDVPANPALREELAEWSDEALRGRLRAAKPEQHNTTDTADRARLIRAIEIAECAQAAEPKPLPPLDPLVLGVQRERRDLHRRIEERLRNRVHAGLIEEVEQLRSQGVTLERLRALGLEYRFVTDYLSGAIRTRNDLVQKLSGAIKAFAKRQETWFRRMERRGTVIHWVPEGRIDAALELVRTWYTARHASRL